MPTGSTRTSRPGPGWGPGGLLSSVPPSTTARATTETIGQGGDSSIISRVTIKTTSRMMRMGGMRRETETTSTIKTATSFQHKPYLVYYNCILPII